MLTPMIGNKLPDNRIWASDTGCFAAPEKYNDDKYIAWLEQRAEHSERCLFATAPDVWGDGPATIEKSLPVLPRVRSAGFKAALVVQPGITYRDIPWSDIDAIFVGGPNDWHRSDDVLDILREAKKHGKWRHQGRVNGPGRLNLARVSGFQSADGTYVAFGPDINNPKLNKWIRAMEKQPMLFQLT